MTLKDKTVIITGASSGLGKALAIHLSRNTMRLVLAARSVEALERTAEEGEKSGSKVLVQPTDVTVEAQCRTLVERTVETFGGIDFLILNAGVSMWARFEDVTDLSIFRKLIETNYLGAVHCVHSALPHLRRNRGTIVAISSLQAFLGVPYHTGYTASKHALKGFLDALELELGDEVHFLNVMPGWVRGTNLRASAFRGDGSRGGATRRHSRHSVSLEECAARIVEAMKKGRREIYIPFKLKYLPWVNLIAPRKVKKMIKKAVEQQEEE